MKKMTLYLPKVSLESFKQGIKKDNICDARFYSEKKFQGLLKVYPRMKWYKVKMTITGETKNG